VEFSGTGPREVLLVGVIPAEVRTGVGLSPAVRAAVRFAVAEVVKELARLGVAPHARSTPRPPDLWWERT
jgi:Ni,Fe-hydrogenase maturation factor